MYDAEHFVRRQRRQPELDAFEVAERALRSHQQVRHVERIGRRHIQVIARDPTLHLRHA